MHFKRGAHHQALACFHSVHPDGFDDNLDKLLLILKHLFNLFNNYSFCLI